MSSKTFAKIKKEIVFTGRKPESRSMVEIEVSCVNEHLALIERKKTELGQRPCSGQKMLLLNRWVIGAGLALAEKLSKTLTTQMGAKFDQIKTFLRRENQSVKNLELLVSGLPQFKSQSDETVPVHLTPHQLKIIAALSVYYCVTDSQSLPGKEDD